MTAYFVQIASQVPHDLVLVGQLSQPGVRAVLVGVDRAAVLHVIENLSMHHVRIGRGHGHHDHLPLSPAHSLHRRLATDPRTILSFLDSCLSASLPPRYYFSSASTTPERKGSLLPHTSLMRWSMSRPSSTTPCRCLPCTRTVCGSPCSGSSTYVSSGCRCSRSRIPAQPTLRLASGTRRTPRRCPSRRSSPGLPLFHCRVVRHWPLLPVRVRLFQVIAQVAVNTYLFKFTTPKCLTII